MYTNLYSSPDFLQISESFLGNLMQVPTSENDQIIGLVDNENYLNIGMNAPFWLPDFLLADRSLQELSLIIDKITAHKKENGLSGIKIRLPPPIYSPTLELFAYCLVKSGFKISNSAIWQYININDFSSDDAYIALLKHSSRKVLNKYLTIDTRLELVENDSLIEVAKAYELLAENREKIGTKLKYSCEYLLALIKLYPSSIFIFRLIVNGRMVASAICHQTIPSILYVAAWGDARHDLKYSPMYIFAKYLIQYCIDKDNLVLDFGVSSDKYIFTPNLFLFKKNIGCKHSLQLTYFIE